MGAIITKIQMIHDQADAAFAWSWLAGEIFTTRRSRPPSHADQSAVLPQLAPLMDYQKSNQIASEDALNCARSHDAVSCRSLRGIETFSDLPCQSPVSKIAEDEDDRIEMNQAGSAKTVGLLRA
jgi:hypothetical protein